MVLTFEIQRVSFFSPFVGNRFVGVHNQLSLKSLSPSMQIITNIHRHFPTEYLQIMREVVELFHKIITTYLNYHHHLNLLVFNGLNKSIKLLFSTVYV